MTCKTSQTLQRTSRTTCSNAPNKAQHSREDNPTSAKIREAFKLGKFEGRARVRMYEEAMNHYKAHADKLAEALRLALKMEKSTGFARNETAIKLYESALADWDRSAQ